MSDEPLDLAGALAKMVNEIRTNSLQAIENETSRLEGAYKNRQVKPDDYLKRKEFLEKQKKEFEGNDFSVQSISVIVQFRDRKIPDIYFDDLKVGDKVIPGIPDTELYQKICYLKFFLETIMSQNSIAQIISGVTGKVVGGVANDILYGVMKANSKMVDQILTMRLQNTGIVPGMSKRGM